MTLVNLKNSGGYMVTDVAVRFVAPNANSASSAASAEFAVTGMRFSGIAAKVLRNSLQHRNTKAVINIECPEDPARNGFVDLSTLEDQTDCVVVTVVHAPTREAFAKVLSVRAKKTVSAPPAQKPVAIANTSPVAGLLQDCIDSVRSFNEQTVSLRGLLPAGKK